MEVGRDREISTESESVPPTVVKTELTFALLFISCFRSPVFPVMRFEYVNVATSIVCLYHVSVYNIFFFTSILLFSDFPIFRFFGFPILSREFTVLFVLWSIT